MRRFKAVQAISEYYSHIGSGELFQKGGIISVWNNINFEFDFYVMVGEFWAMIG